jgi:hypothetical protein
VDSDARESKVTGRPLKGQFSNHFEVAFTQFEFLLDFGQAYDEAAGPILHSRIITTPYAAKVLSRMLLELLEQYEDSVGPVPAKDSSGSR